ncbi:hypothetical protein AVEN_39675-1 [Araneus ventricosus]|uniref:Uncharacterized protein n=1 Tax=Araneus ventricosus TaxID=182803 RepID=A0A4Y2Q670_ARAVE|nr:hypothetical protein AVEN_39675-1 [Araneus ventricosus]
MCVSAFLAPKALTVCSSVQASHPCKLSHGHSYQLRLLPMKSRSSCTPSFPISSLTLSSLLSSLASPPALCTGRFVTRPVSLIHVSFFKCYQEITAMNTASSL